MKSYEIEFQRRKNINSKNTSYCELVQQIDTFLSYLHSFAHYTNNFYEMQMTFKKPTEHKKERNYEELVENIDLLNHLDLRSLVASSVNTLYNVRNCIEISNIPDAMTLLRKFKDDMLLFIYFIRLSSINPLEYNSDKKLDKLNKKIMNVIMWTNNSMSDVYYVDAIDLLKTDSNLARLDKETNIFKDFIDITKDLNNYAHSNGWKYVNYINPEIREKEITNLFIELKIKMNKIFSYLFTLIFYLKPIYLMSSDYLDYKDEGMVPPLGSEKWVANIHQEFIDNIINETNSKLKLFLVNNSPMDIR